ncbi:hypothetical protein CRM22_008299 [Opisthorchis felineus]|uniref:G-protein coupled receptors family 1 profile domain-containing protein n=1 Tax=Opisthorchis felineus TaxID=147828 RepID=A0A4V3SDJ3_OPIFE|nr:hypothetical protein CRM22_008299 [Opisthorchis felineus]
MNTNDTLVRRWVMISHFELWEIVLFTVLFSLLVIVAVIGNAIVCILLRFRYMRCARYLKSLCNREARKLIGTGIYREYVTDNLWADECASSQHECSCGKIGIASTPGRVVIFKNTESRPGSLEGSTGALTGNITIVQPSLNSNAQDKSKNRYNELVRALSTKHRNRSGRGVSITSLFLFNLSLADFLMAILCIPPYIVTEIAAFYWPFGEPLCKIINYSQGVSIFVSSLTHVVISLDRFVLVYFPLRPRIRYRTAVGLLVGVWLLASLIPLPIMIVNRVRLSKTGSRCVEDWSLLFSNLTTKGKVPNMEYFLSIFDGQLTIELRSTYTVILMILQYFVPLGVICGTYAAIAVRVSGMQTPGERDLNRDQNLIRARKKMIKMLMTVAIMYGLSHLPHHILYLHGSIHREFWRNSWAVRLWALATLLRDSSTCYNPFIYAWVNKTFRKDVHHLLALSCLPCALLKQKCRSCCSGQQRVPGMGGHTLPVDGSSSVAAQRRQLCRVSHNHHHLSLPLRRNIHIDQKTSVPTMRSFNNHDRPNTSK